MASKTTRKSTEEIERILRLLETALPQIRVVLEGMKRDRIGSVEVKYGRTINRYAVTISNFAKSLAVAYSTAKPDDTDE